MINPVRYPDGRGSRERPSPAVRESRGMYELQTRMEAAYVLR